MSTCRLCVRTLALRIAASASTAASRENDRDEPRGEGKLESLGHVVRLSF